MTGVNGILITMSAGLYVPLVEVIDHGTRQTCRCEYNSVAAREAGLENPEHWGHAVYRTMKRLCDQHQAELQGGSMAAYEETESDRRTARAVAAGAKMDDDGRIARR